MTEQDYSITWKYIVNKMEENGISPDDETKRAFFEYEIMIENVWNKFIDDMEEHYKKLDQS